MQSTVVFKMLIYRVFFILPFLILAFGVEKLAAEALTLPDLLARAEKNAAYVQDNDALRRLAASKLEQVHAGMWLPEFTATATGGVVPKVKIDQNAPVIPSQPKTDLDWGNMSGFGRVEADAVQPIYTFGKISSLERMAKKGKELAQEQITKQRLELRLLVKKAYYSLQYANDALGILTDVEDKLSTASEKVEDLLIKNAKNVSEIDRLKIRVFEADVKNRSLDADRGQKLSRAALEELAGLSGDWTLEQPGLQAEKIPPVEKESVISAALRSQPELRQLGTLITIKQNERRSIMADLFPTIFIAGKVEYSKAPGRSEVNNPYLTDPFNIFDLGAVVGLREDLGWWRTKAKMDQSQAEIDRLKAQKEELTIKTKLDAERSYEEALSALSAIKINEDGFRAARGWLISAGLSFDLGTTETKDMLESFAAYFKAKVDLTKSFYTLDVALADLSQIAGYEILPYLNDVDNSGHPTKIESAPGPVTSPSVPATPAPSPKSGEGAPETTPPTKSPENPPPAPVQ